MSVESELQRAFSLIRQLQGALDGKTTRTGSGSATWTAAVLSAPVVIAHGLGRVPTHKDVQTESQLFEFKVTADATNLTITGYRTDNTAQSSTILFTWMAIG